MGKASAMQCDERKIKMMVRECQIMARLQSEMLVRYYDAWVEEMTEDIIDGFFDGKVKGMNEPHKWLVLCVQLELCDTDLKGFLQENSRKMNTKDKWEIFRQCLEGIEFLHSKGLVHRDLKPGNVFVNLDQKTGKVACKIADLGLAKFKDKNALLSNDAPMGNCKTTYKADMTRGCGTPLYGAPEQFSSKQYGSKVDIYALGIILFEIFVHFSDKRERYKAIEGLRKDPSRTLDKYMRKWPIAKGLVRAMVKANPDKRPTCLDIVRDPDIPLGEPTSLTPMIRAYMEREMNRKCRQRRPSRNRRR